jgi:putative FmdB family regulatory protein
MPRYDYICKNKKCDTDTFEEVMGFDDNDKVRCPDCNRLTNKRKDFYAFSHQWSHDARNDHLFP